MIFASLNLHWPQPVVEMYIVDVVYSGSWRDFMLETAQLMLKYSLFPRFHISKKKHLFSEFLGEMMIHFDEDFP